MVRDVRLRTRHSSQHQPGSHGTATTCLCKCRTGDCRPRTRSAKLACQNLYAEASGGCDSQWLASAFTGSGRSAWVYQYTVPFAAHGADIAGYWGPPTDYQGPDFVTAFRSMFPFCNFRRRSLSLADDDIQKSWGISLCTTTHPSPAI